jgi:hypothetical protein
MRACTRQTEMFHGTQSFLPTSSSQSGYAACTWGKQSENAGSVMGLGLKSDAAGCCDGGVLRYLDSEMRACRVPESCRPDLRATNGQNMDCRPRLLTRAALRCLRRMDLSLRVESTVGGDGHGEDAGIPPCLRVMRCSAFVCRKVASVIVKAPEMRRDERTFVLHIVLVFSYIVLHCGTRRNEPLLA